MPSRCLTLKGKVSLRLICKFPLPFVLVFLSPKVQVVSELGEVRVGCRPVSYPTQRLASSGSDWPGARRALPCPAQPSLGVPSPLWDLVSPISVWKCMGSVGSPGVIFPVVEVGLEGK